MEDQQFCLKWGNHHSNMVDIFGRLLSNETLCDVTLACDGFSLKAHKLILSASSSFFQNLFLENPCSHPVIILPELKYTDMKALVEFIYNGQVNVSESQLPKLLKAAENLRIKGLSDCRMQNSADSDTSETSADGSFLKMDCLEQTKQFEKQSDSNSCNLEFQESSEVFNPDAVCRSSQASTSNSQSSNKQSNLATLEPDDHTSVQSIENTEMAVSDSEVEMEPSKMMEQTMTTDNIYKEESTDNDPVSNKDLCVVTEAETSIVSEDNSTKLPEIEHVNEMLPSTMQYSTPNTCASKETISSNETTFSNSPNKEILFKEESVPGPSTITVFSETTIQNPYSSDMGSFTDADMKNGAKRGRRPGSRLCVLCKHIFSSEFELEKHMENHKNDSYDTASDCKKFPKELESSDSQFISEKNLVNLPVPCATCSCLLNTMSDAQSHLSMNPNCRTSQFKCLLCPKLFIWPATLIKHFREQHQGPGGTARVTQRLWFFCDICKKPLLSKHALCLHRTKFHGYTSQTLGSDSSDNSNVCKRGRKQGTRVCRLCKRTFTSTADYHSHLQDFHRNNMLFNTAVETSPYANESLSSTENESNSAQSVI